MYNTFLPNDDENKYITILADYYQHYSKYRNIACYQACLFISKLEQNKRLIEFIKSKECQIYVRSYDRTYFLTVRFSVSKLVK